MKKALLPPILVLASILGFVYWTSQFISTQTTILENQLHFADSMVSSQNWSAVESTLESSYKDWSSCQNYFQILLPHDAVDDADAMYRRCLTYTSARSSSALRAEIADLQDQLHTIAEMEQFSIRNIL